MSKKKVKNLWLWIFIALAILVALLFMFFLKPNQQSIAGGGNTPSGTPTTNCPVKDCEKCQARWLDTAGGFVFLGDYSNFGWTCSGLCTTGGECYMSEGYSNDPYDKPTCTCGSPPSDGNGDTCYTIGGGISRPTCGGSCIDTSEQCLMQLNGFCECAETPQDYGFTPCSSVSTPNERTCSEAYCSEGSTCIYDWKYGVCYCSQSAVL